MYKPSTLAWHYLPVILMPYSVTVMSLSTMCFLFSGLQSLWLSTVFYQWSRYITNSFKNYKETLKHWHIMHKNLTVNLKSLSPQYGCKMVFCSSCLLNVKRHWSNQKICPFLLWNMSSQRHFHYWFVLLWRLNHLEHLKHTHMYNFLLHLTNLYCQINMHLWKTGKLDVLKCQFWNLQV